MEAYVYSKRAQKQMCHTSIFHHNDIGNKKCLAIENYLYNIKNQRISE